MVWVRRPAAALLCLCLAVSALADEETFDVPGGDVQPIYRLEYSPNASVKCNLSISAANPSEQWGSTLSIILSETEDVLTRSDTLRFVQLMLSVDTDRDSHIYYLIVNIDGESHNYDFLRTGGEEPDAFVSLGFRDDGVFGYRARDGEDTFAQGYELEPRVQPKYATVVASGLAGTVVCGIGSLE